MGEQAELILNGDVCEGCGEEFHNEGPGYPRRCASCGGANHRKTRSGLNPLKQEKIDEAFRMFKSAGFEWDSFNNGLHWKLAGMDFYPTTHKWFDNKNDFRGEGIKEFIKYIRTRQHKQAPPNKILTVDQVFEIAKHSKDKSLLGICEAIHKGIYG